VRNFFVPRSSRKSCVSPNTSSNLPPGGVPDDRFRGVRVQVVVDVAQCGVIGALSAGDVVDGEIRIGADGEGLPVGGPRRRAEMRVLDNDLLLARGEVTHDEIRFARLAGPRGFAPTEIRERLAVGTQHGAVRLARLGEPDRVALRLETQAVLQHANGHALRGRDGRVAQAHIAHRIRHALAVRVELGGLDLLALQLRIARHLAR